jgi:predicted aspartyl protease
MNLPSYLKSLSYEEIPLVKETTGHLTLQAKANGEDLTLMIDTGASITSIAESCVERLHLTPGPIEKVGAALALPRKTASVSNLESLELGSIKIKNLKIWLVDFSYVNMVLEMKGVSCDGVLGVDVLTSRSAVIDYRGRKLYLENKDKI